MSKAAVIYWSGTGNTEMMADAIEEGLKSAGADVKKFPVEEINPEDALAYDKLALGCPSMGDEVLEELDFEPFFKSIEGGLAGKQVALFGSYGWGDGEWMRDWQERVIAAKAELHQGEGLILNETPDDDGLEECKTFGKTFAD